MRRIGSVEAALGLFDPLRDAPCEMAAFAYLDPEWRLLGLRHTPPGLRDAILLPMRDVAADAIAFGAAAVVMAHNHPSGSTRPSTADRSATRRIAMALAALDVRLVEHLIVSGDEWTSFRALGLL